MNAFRNGFAAAAGATLFGVALLALARLLKRDDDRVVALAIGPTSLTLDAVAGIDAPEGGPVACSMLY